MSLFFKIRFKNLIPQRRTNAIPKIRVRVVVHHVVLFHLFPNFVFHIEMVDGIMRDIVKKIAQKESSKKCGQVFLWNKAVKNEIE